MIVAIEGIDAAGKNAQVEALYRRFALDPGKQFETVRKHDFPHYSTTAGGVVGRILQGKTIIVDANDIERDDMSPVSLAEKWGRDKAIIVQSVMVADRLEHLQMLVEFAQSPNNLLLLDRYKMSGVAYGAAEGVEATWTRTVQSCLPDADLNVLLDISVDESLRRRPERRDVNERDLDKLHRARGYYMKEFAHSAENDPHSYVVIAGSQSVHKVTYEIVVAIMNRISVLQDDQALTIAFMK